MALSGRAWNIFMYKWQGQPDRGAFTSALGMQDWSVRVSNKRRLAVFDSDSIFRILYVRHRDWASTIELWRHHGFTCILAQLVKRRLYWFGLAVRRSKKKLIRSRQTERQLKTWATTTKADLEPFSEAQVFGYERWRKCWVRSPCVLAQDRRT